MTTRYRSCLLACAAVLWLCLPLCARASAVHEEDERFIPPPLQPQMTILSPKPGEAADEDHLLTVEAQGLHAERVEVVVSWAGGELRETAEANHITATFALPRIPSQVTLTVRGFSPVTESGYVLEGVAKRVLPAPREALIEEMISLAYRDSKLKRYNPAPAQTDTDIGVCKNFVMRMFSTHSNAYEMLEYPGLKLRMPLNNLKVNVAPYQYGIEWALDGPETGNPFDIVASFRYDPDLTKEENEALATAFLRNVQRGDCYQMVGNYVDGNGPHTLLFIADYDPVNDMLHWTDSNMKGTRINGDRWGYIQYDCARSVPWMVKAICTKNRGATLYRLREDLVRK